MINEQFFSINFSLIDVKYIPLNQIHSSTNKENKWLKFTINLINP